MKSLKTWVALSLAIALVTAVAHAVPPGTADDIRARLQPAGTLCRSGQDCGVVAAAASAEARSGEQVYGQFCFACHTTGVAGAPVLGDAEAWAPRLAQGMELLWEHTVNGINAMPAMGTCMTCSEEELRASLDYMIADL